MPKGERFHGPTGMAPSFRRSRSGIDLDEILAASGESSSDGFFGFSNGGGHGLDSDVKTVDQPIATLPSEGFDDFDDEDEQTMVAEIPKELLNEVQAGAEEERHFRQVFNQFVTTQKQCGGTTSGLTYDKFARKLRATRDDLKKRHEATSVRFTVYVKDGRAALRASPLHD